MRNWDSYRIFMKPQGKAADMEEAMIIRYGATIGDVCDKLHRDFRKRFRYAQIWGIRQSMKDSAPGLTIQWMIMIS